MKENRILITWMITADVPFLSIKVDIQLRGVLKTNSYCHFCVSNLFNQNKEKLGNSMAKYDLLMINHDKIRRRLRL